MEPEYTKNYHELKSVFTPALSGISIPGSDIRIANLNFNSGFAKEYFSTVSDASICENMSFSYPVFIPPGSNGRKVIILLHGLNERSWEKYLVWAYRLSKNTGSFVILFPLSFHINRSPGSWVDPRAMMQPLSERRSIHNDVRMSSYANLALSNRLTRDPMRFFSSGCQTASDIVKLMSDLRDGNHELIPAGSVVNIFAYSIGAFLAQILMIGNPDNLFSDSRLFMLCGGSVFSTMRGTSKFIMDSLAFDKVYNFYLDDFEKEISKVNYLSEFTRSSQLGMAFRSMIDFSRFKAFRENILLKLKERIRSVALLRDTVIPAEGILTTLSGSGRNNDKKVEVWDFPYPYTHENPFPVFSNNHKNDVDRSFERLIKEASVFLA